MSSYYITSPNILNSAVSGQNIILSVEFTPSDYDAAKTTYDTAFIYSLIAKDINLDSDINAKEYKFFLALGDNATAPVFKDMEFVRWQNDSTSSTISNSDLISMIGANNSVNIYYRPVVNTINVTFDGDVKAGENIPELINVIVTITNNWRIDNAILTWNSSDVKAGGNTIYIARISVNKSGLMGTNLDDSESQSTSLAGDFSFADDVKVIVKDIDGNNITITNSIFYEDDNNIILDLVFSKTGKIKIVRFADVSVTVSHSSTKEDVLQALPSEIFAYLSDERIALVPVDWISVDDIETETLEVQNIYAYGFYDEEDYVLADGVSLKAQVTVLAVERTVSPNASPGNGKYAGVKIIYLEAAEGATIYYALAEPNSEGEKPDSSTLDFIEYIDHIIISECEKTILLYTYAKKDGLRDSTVTIYSYEFIHDLIMHEENSATCTDDGNIEYWQCSICDKYYYDEEGINEIGQEDTIISAIGHTYGDWTITKEATCTESGSKERVCTVCDHKETEEIEALGHTYGDWTITKEAKVGIKGEETRTCSLCGETETREIPALPYEYEVVDGVKVYKFEFVQGQVQDLSGLFAEAKAENGKVSLSAGTLSLTFDVNAVNVLGDETVFLTASVSTENLTIDGAKLVVDVTLTGTSANFASGKVTISVPFTEAIPDGKVVKVYYVNGSEKTDMNATFNEGKVTFETNHFSSFAVMLDNAKTNGLPAYAIVLIVLASLAVLCGACFCVYHFAIRKKAI